MSPLKPGTSDDYPRDKIKNTVVYMWVRKDNTPYYIGIGNCKRPYIGKRSCGYPPPKDRVIILHENLDWRKACKIEKELIAFYGRKDVGTGILRNMTDGGEGLCNPPGSVREKISKSKIGKKHTEQARANMSKSQLGKKLSKETKEKLSKVNRGRKHTEESKAKFSGENHHMYGKKHTRKSLEKMSISMKGENHPNYGKNLPEETRKKISEKHKGKIVSEETRKKLSSIFSGENHPRYLPEDWYHPNHGEILQKSASDVVKLFPEQKLSKTHLREVARGERIQHKGWVVVLEKVDSSIENNKNFTPCR
jgi:hypothetical protein